MKRVLPILIIIFLHIFLLTQTRFTVWPEMILYPWLLNNDFKLYQNIINPYFPFLSLILSGVFRLFGESVTTLKIFTYLIIVIYDLIIYLIVFRFTKNNIKSLLILFYFILVQVSFGGNGLWFELFLAPIVISSLALFYFGRSNLQIILASTLMSLSILTKQNSALFLLPIIIYFINQKEYKRILLSVTAMFLSALPVFVFILSQGIFYDFINWTIKLPLNMSKVPGFVSLPSNRQFLLLLFLLLPALLILKRDFKRKYFWIIAAAISSLFAFPRYEDFHLQVLIGFSAILLAFVSKRAILVFLIVGFLLSSRTIVKNWQVPDRFIDQDLHKAVEIIKPLNSVYLLNSPELAYFFADKLPPKIWATNFPWYFTDSIFEEKYIQNLKDQKIEYIVIGKRLGGDYYALGNYVPPKILELLNKDYKLVKEEGNLEVWKRLEK